MSRAALLPVLVVACCSLVLAGCDGDAGESSSSSPTSAAADPSPSEDRARTLVVDLDTIARGLADDPDLTIQKARAVCRVLLAGDSNPLDATLAEFSGAGAGDLSVEQADRIIGLLEGEEWCE